MSEQGGLIDTLGIEIETIREDKVVVSLDVTARHHQPAGFMHGGISLVLAETAASIGADTSTDEDVNVFGMEINANHLKPFKTGRLRAVAEPLHRGNSTHVWEVNLLNNEEERICRSRCTLSVRSGSQ
ncbi:MAG: PaaI family thioesterase [bacterium]